jgi:hypothetical protein
MCCVVLLCCGGKNLVEGLSETIKAAGIAELVSKAFAKCGQCIGKAFRVMEERFRFN